MIDWRADLERTRAVVAGEVDIPVPAPRLAPATGHTVWWSLGTEDLWDSVVIGIAVHADPDTGEIDTVLDCIAWRRSPTSGRMEVVCESVPADRVTQVSGPNAMVIRDRIRTIHAQLGRGSHRRRLSSYELRLATAANTLYPFS